jgi:hypothetical protein
MLKLKRRIFRDCFGLLKRCITPKSLLLTILISVTTFITYSQTILTIEDVLNQNTSYSDKIEAIEANNNEVYNNSDPKQQKKYLRMRSFTDYRLDNNGSFVQYKTQWQNTFNLLNSGNLNGIPSGLSFDPIGPIENEMPFDYRNYIGRVECVEIHPITGDVYIGTANAGLWKTSTMSGPLTNWELVTDKFPGVGVFSIAFHPTDSNIMLIVTGSQLWSTFLMTNFNYGTGIFKTTNGGSSWSHAEIVQPSEEILFRQVMFKEGDPTKAYALSNKRFYTSDDAGDSWSSDTLPTSPYRGYEQLAIGTGDRKNLMLASGLYCLAMSDDFGVTWDNVSQVGSPPTSISDERASVTYSHVNEKFYLLIFNDNDRHLYNLSTTFNTSTNQWEYGNWTKEIGITFPCASAFCLSKSTIREPLVANQYGLFIGGVSYLNKYNLNNLNANPSIKDFGHVDFRGLAAIDANTCYVANDGGVTEVNFNTSEFISHCGNLSLQQFVNVAITEDNNDLILCDAWDNEVWRKDGNSWIYDSWGDGGLCVISRADASVRYKNVKNYMSRYNNSNWSSTSLKRHAGTPIVINPRPGKLAFTQGTIVSGVSATLLALDYDALGSFDPELIVQNTFEGDEILDMEQSYRNPNLLILSTGNFPHDADDGTKLYKVLHNYQQGQTPSANVIELPTTPNLNDPLRLALATNFTSDIEINPVNDQEFWVSTMGFNEGNKVFHTTDGGISFVNISSGIPNIPINKLKYDELNHRLYLGTDFGLFYLDDGQTQWTYDPNTLVMMVADIDINRETREMFFSIWGRGLWKADLPCASNNGTSITIESDEVWDFPQWCGYDIVVESGHTLTISSPGILKMAPNTKIIVEPNARLLIDGGTITSVCDDQWDGVIIEGTKSQNQYPEIHPTYQGVVKLTNGATIENAHTAITTGYGSTTAGGVIQAYDSYFNNNRRSVEFLAYDNKIGFIIMPNFSHFENCVFKVDDQLNTHSGSKPFKKHISAWQVEGIEFIGCKFSNERTDKVWNSAKPYNRAIAALSSNLKIVGSCNDPDANGEITAGTPADFEGFDRAIELGGHNESYSSQINKCSFSNNVYGVHIDVMPQVSIRRNLFTIGTCDISALNSPYNYGTSLKKCSGFEIEENNFTHAGNYISIGLHPKNTNMESNADENNQLYCNYTFNMRHAVFSSGNNKGQGNSKGLRLLCNKFTASNLTDIKIEPIGTSSNSDGIGVKQGQFDATNSNEIAAGNKFSQNTSAYHLFHNCSESFTYLYNGSDASTIPTNNFSTYLQTIDLVSADVVANTCPSNIQNGIEYPMDAQKEAELYTRFNSAKLAYWNLYYNYQQLIDGGSTPAMLLEIQNTWPQEAWDLRNDLLAISPYVSREALLEAAHSGILPDALLLETCLANPDATQSEDFLMQLENDIPNPLPLYMIELIRDSWDTETPRTILEGGLANYGAEKDYTFNRLMANKKFISPAGKDYIAIRTLHLSRNELHDRYAIVDVYMAENNYGSASDELSSIPLNYTLSDLQVDEHENYVDYVEIMEAMFNSSKTIYELTQAEIDELELIADANTGLSSAKARNLLCFAYDLCDYYYPDTTGSGNPKAIPAIHESADKVYNDLYNKVTVSPNPAKDYTTFSWELTSLKNNAVLEIFNVSGKLVHSKNITHKTGSYIWDTSKQKTGIYIYRVVENDNILNSGKVTINK